MRRGLRGACLLLLTCCDWRTATDIVYLLRYSDLNLDINNVVHIYILLLFICIICRPISCE